MTLRRVCAPLGHSFGYNNNYNNNNYYYYTLLAWNNLPSQSREDISYEQFKQQLKFSS